MKVEKFTVRMGETIPTREFANVRPEVEVTVVVGEGEDPRAVFNHAKKLAAAAFDEVRSGMLGVRPLASTPQQPVSVPQPPQVVPMTTTGVQQPLSYADNTVGGVRPAVAPPPPGNGIPAVDPVTW